MTVLVVRHARAGRRERWTGDDYLRPLSKRGREQASQLVAVLDPWLHGRPKPILLSSSWVRCIQTLEPAARVAGVEVTPSEVLGEGTWPKARDALPGWLRARTVILCTHGDVIDELIGWLVDSGVPGHDVKAVQHSAKASVWVIDAKNGSVRSVRYVPPPK